MDTQKTTSTKRSSKKSSAASSKSGNGKTKSNNGQADGDDGFTGGSINNNVRQIADKPKRIRAEAQDLPGMTDRKIKPLHDKAKEYVALRDQRMALGAQEVEAKGQLLDLMHAHKKENYICEGIEITIISEQEKIKVKVAKGDDNESDEALMSE